MVALGSNPAFCSYLYSETFYFDGDIGLALSVIGVFLWLWSSCTISGGLQRVFFKVICNKIGALGCVASSGIFLGHIFVY